MMRATVPSAHTGISTADLKERHAKREVNGGKATEKPDDPGERDDQRADVQSAGVPVKAAA